MTKLEALKALAAKVEAGGDASPFAHLSDEGLVMFSQDFIDAAQRAYRGSLDAAKALHEAVLPGWTWSGGLNAHYHDAVMFVRKAADGEIILEFDGCLDANPARAWLLAIIKALIAQEEAAC